MILHSLTQPASNGAVVFVITNDDCTTAGSCVAWGIGPPTIGALCEWDSWQRMKEGMRFLLSQLEKPRPIFRLPTEPRFTVQNKIIAHLRRLHQRK